MLDEIRHEVHSDSSQCRDFPTMTISETINCSELSECRIKLPSRCLLHQNSGSCSAITCHTKHEVMKRCLLIGAASQTRTGRCHSEPAELFRSCVVSRKGFRSMWNIEGPHRNRRKVRHIQSTFLAK